MTNKDIMAANLGKVFEYSFADGERTVGKLLEVNLDGGVFIYEMTSTTEPTRYQNRQNRYSAAFDELSSVELLDKD